MLDRDHEVIEKYGFVNVPSGVWIDEDDRIVRAADIVYGDRMWFEFHHTPPEPHLDALRAWVIDGVLPEGEVARQKPRVPSADEQLAREHYRVAVHLLRSGAARGGRTSLREGGRAGALGLDDPPRIPTAARW